MPAQNWLALSMTCRNTGMVTVGYNVNLVDLGIRTKIGAIMELYIENLSVDLGAKEILKQLSLTAQAGTLTTLLGASGCGKTTLLKAVAGLIEPLAGNICLGGAPIMHLPPEKRNTVIVFQDLRLFPHLNVEKNIAYAMQLQKKDKAYQKRKVSELLESVHLEGFEKRKIRALSGGQQQRVALARALAAEPKILLLDEPFSGLDEQLRLEMGKLVRQIQNKNKITTILVTHDKREALQMSDKIALMQAGQILQYDAPETIYRSPSSLAVAEYFGKINEVDGKFFRPSEVTLTCGDDYEVTDLIFMGDLVELTLQGNNKQILCQTDGRAYAQNRWQVGDRTGIEIHRYFDFEGRKNEQD